MWRYRRGGAIYYTKRPENGWRAMVIYGSYNL